MELSESDKQSLAQARRMRDVQKVFIVISMGVALMALVSFWPLCRATRASTIMTKRSPDGRHTAKLTRTDSIDLNFHVIVDGTPVYHSPDLFPGNADCREHLIWSTDSQTVVLELAGRRIFGYQAAEKRPLADSELLKVQFTPFEEILSGGKRQAEAVHK